MRGNYVKVTVLPAILLMALASAQAAEHEVQREIASYWVEHYARVYQVPVELVEAIIEVESSWSPNAVSNKGAAGLMQLMPRTAIRFGVWNRFRIEENIRGGVAYLAWLQDTFRGDLRLVTAAYLVGESSIRLRGLAYSSPEVYRYVSRVAELYRVKRLLKSRQGETGAAMRR